MPRKPTVTRRSPDRSTLGLAEMIAREARARSGPNATFEQRRDAAAAVTAEVLAMLAQDDGASDVDPSDPQKGS